MILRPNGALEAASAKLLAHREDQCLRSSAGGPGILASPLVRLPPPLPPLDCVRLLTGGLSEYRLCPLRCLRGTTWVVLRLVDFG